MTEFSKFSKLHPATKRTWIKALRSGKYKQAVSVLKETVDGSPSEFKHCCLGVLCEVSPRARSVLSDVSRTDCTFGGEAFITDESGKYPAFLNEETQDELSTMNDRGTSFKRIATWIEKNL